jgi:hypothetical protein
MPGRADFLVVGEVWPNRSAAGDGESSRFLRYPLLWYQ